MNEQNQTKKERKASADSQDKSQPIKMIRHGAMAAAIWKRQSPAGYVYYDFSLSRSWKSLSTEKAGYSHNYFANNKEALLKCVDEAVQWIQENQPEVEVAPETLAA